MAGSPPLFQDSGTSQQGRQVPALLPTHVRLADYSTEKLLAYVAHFSKLVRYYEVIDNQVESQQTWDLADKRSLLIVALIATQRLPAQYETYTRLVRELDDPMATSEQRQQVLKTIVGRIYKMAELLDKWYEAHQKSQLRTTFQAELRVVTESLIPSLRNAVAYEAALIEAGALPPPTPGERRPDQLKHLWQPLGQAEGASPQPTAVASGEMQAYLTEQLGERLTTILWEFHQAQASLKNLAHRTLLKSLRGEESQQQDVLPEIALLITFLELYQYAQRTLNQIPRRHLDFYYQQLLRVAFRPARPDHAFLTFGLAKAVPAYVLPAGTEVEGGKDAAGTRVVFSTLQNHLLAPWRVQQFSSLFVSGHPAGQVKGIYVAPRADLADGPGNPGPPTAPDWAPFGEDQSLIGPAHRTMADATVGFAVSAAVLLLQEGRRAIELSLRCDAASFQRFCTLLTAAGQPLQQAFDALAPAAFRVEITGAPGWLPLRVQEVSLMPATCTVTWHLTLEREQAAVVPHQPELHAGRFRSEWPILRLLLNERAPDYAYSSFSSLQPRTIALRVRAQDVQGVQLSNQLGPLTPGLPFPPFGTQPQRGAYLLVGFPELFRKRLTQLVLTLDWAQLPSDPGGFADYYQGYPQPVDNHSFQVAVSYRRDWRWLPASAPASSLSLFQTIPDATRRTGTTLLPTSHLALQTGMPTDFRQQPPLPAGRLAAAEAATGAFRLELVEPQQGFGSEQYPSLLVDTLQYNARNPSRPRTLPRPPFVPMVKSVWLNYAAEENIDVAALFGPETKAGPQFYHLHPLAEYQPSRPVAPQTDAEPSSLPFPGSPAPSLPRRVAYSLSLLPEFADEGTLYIGLTNLTPPQTINLLFELSYRPNLPRDAPAEQGQQYAGGQPLIEWSYLVQDEWRPFAQGASLRDDIVRDESNSLTEQRPVYLTLPAALDTHHSVMPDGLCWVRATVRQGAAFISRVRAVHAQVVAAVRVSAGPEQPGEFVANLPAQTLNRLIKPLPALARVEQPVATFGGHAAETHAEYYTRVSERLRHRGRAVTPWDYEHIVLDCFPDVYQARCLRTDQLPARLRKPGQVMIIVLPQQPPVAADQALGHRLPHFSPGQLAKIQAWLQQAASPHVRLEVCNPLYEVIQVRCRVRFTRAARHSHPQPGVLTQRLKHDLTAFLSPWNQRNAARQGQHSCLTSALVLAFLNQLAYVELVAAFSVVKMALENEQYLFYDTEALPLPGTAPAPDSRPGQPQPLEDVSRRPWSVYVSAWQHDIEELDNTAAQTGLPTAQPTGIGSLGIGSDFVIARSFDSPPPPRSANR